VGTFSGTTIQVVLPSTSSLTAAHLATFNATGTSTTVGASSQISGCSFNDYSAPLTYTVTAADGTTRTYTVYIATNSGCFNTTKERDETDSDCGGVSCIKCWTGKHCNMGSECQSGSCVINTCQ